MQAAVSARSSKWNVAILAELAEGTHRFNEHLRHIDGVSRRNPPPPRTRGWTLEHKGVRPL
jgi:hypothetical protein